MIYESRERKRETFSV
uniref:Uncharacterized protein n=1 Tax=Rhizophora mucronata TaxID=61149 RepID=A0A2P2IW50_RHIMU